MNLCELSSRGCDCEIAMATAVLSWLCAATASAAATAMLIGAQPWVGSEHQHAYLQMTPLVATDANVLKWAAEETKSMDTAAERKEDEQDESAWQAWETWEAWQT